MSNFREKGFWVKVYKTDKIFFQQGQNMYLHCDHVWNGNYGMNTYGQVVPLPEATLETVTSPPIYVPAVMDPQGTVFPSPTAFANNFVAVTRIKDMVLLEEFVVDTASYNANRVNCNTSR